MGFTPLSRSKYANASLEQAVQTLPNLRSLVERAKTTLDSSERFELAKLRTVISVNLGVIDLPTAEKKPASPDAVGFEASLFVDASVQGLAAAGLVSESAIRAIDFLKILRSSEKYDGQSIKLFEPSFIFEKYSDLLLVCYLRMVELLSETPSVASKINQLICSDDLLWPNGSNLPKFDREIWWVPLFYASLASYLSTGLYNLLMNSSLSDLEPKRYNLSVNYLQKQKEEIGRTKDVLKEIFQRLAGIAEWKLRIKCAGSVASKTRKRVMSMHGRHIKREIQHAIDRFPDLVGGMITVPVSSSAELRAFSESLYRTLLIGDFRKIRSLERDTLESTELVRSVVSRFKALKPGRVKCEVQIFTPDLLDEYHFGPYAHGLYKKIPGSSASYVSQSDLLHLRTFLEELDRSRRDY